MNTVTHEGYINAANTSTDAILCVNGKYVSAYTRCIGYKAPRYETPVKVWQCSGLANEWNESNRLTFEAKTLKGLISKLAKHPYKLVK
jgi:hypothetical protein